MRKTWLNFLLAICLLGQIVCFAAGIFLMNHHAVIFQQNAIGALYQKDEDMSREYLYVLYTDISEENLLYSEEAFQKFGFTEHGLSYLADSMDLVRKCLPVIALGLLMLGCVIFALFQNQRVWKTEKQELEARIYELEQSQMRDDYIQEQNRRMQIFIENIAHQIKTPISRVYSSLYMIEDETVEPHKQERIHECYSHLESVNMLMKRLLDIGKLEAGKIIFQKERICFDELMADVVRSCTDHVRRANVVITTDGSMEYYGDYDLLKEAFANIVNNALEHDKSSQPLEITCKCNQEHMKVSIRDHGSGLSEKDIPNLFDRFYLPETVKSTHTGIGLNLAKLIFEGHFGDVYVYNHAEGGAVFNVILPMYSLKIGKVQQK